MKIKSLKTKTREKDDAWARRVKDRDGWKCIVCGKTDRLNAHHIIPREVQGYKYDLANGVSLCVKHHKFDRDISAHCAPFAFLIWLKRCRPEQYELAHSRLNDMLFSNDKFLRFYDPNKIVVEDEYEVV